MPNCDNCKYNENRNTGKDTIKCVKTGVEKKDNKKCIEWKKA